MRDGRQNVLDRVDGRDNHHLAETVVLAVAAHVTLTVRRYRQRFALQLDVLTSRAVRVLQFPRKYLDTYLPTFHIPKVPLGTEETLQ